MDQGYNPKAFPLTPAQVLKREAGGRARAAAGAITGQQNAGNAGLNGIQGQLLARPGPSPAQNLAAANRSGVMPGGYSAPPITQTPAAVAGGQARPASSAFGSTAGLFTQTNQGPLAAGSGAGGIAAVDAALTGYDPRFQVPGTGQMGAMPGQVQGGALPGTVQGGPLPGTVGMGAMPGATDRGLQQQALDRVLAFDPSVGESVAQRQLQDATQQNLSQTLALARSARGGPAAQAQAMRMAQAEGAATMSQTARDAAILRAKEEDTRKARELEALGMGGDLSTQIRGADVLERQQNVGALEAELNAGVTQRGQSIASLDNALNAGVTQRGQTIQSRDNDVNAGVAQRGQDVNALIADRNAGVTERGQTIGANQAQSQLELDSILGRGQLAQSERQAGVAERGQTLDALLGTEQTKQARDAVAASSMTAAEQTEAQILMTKAQLGYQLTYAEQRAMMKLADKLNDPSIVQYITSGVQAVANTAQATASVARGGGAG